MTGLTGKLKNVKIFYSAHGIVVIVALATSEGFRIVLSEPLLLPHANNLITS